MADVPGGGGGTAPFISITSVTFDPITNEWVIQGTTSDSSKVAAELRSSGGGAVPIAAGAGAGTWESRVPNALLVAPNTYTLFAEQRQGSPPYQNASIPVP